MAIASVQKQIPLPQTVREVTEILSELLCIVSVSVNGGARRVYIPFFFSVVTK